MGWFHFLPTEATHLDEVELGYRLRKSVWGKGYAPEGSRALITKGLAELGVQRVVAFKMVVHVATRRVMEKAGLRLVRTFHEPWTDHIEGEEEGRVEYALLRSEWDERTAEEVEYLPRVSSSDASPTWGRFPSRGLPHIPYAIRTAPEQSGRIVAP